ncbi:MAG: hypothetical protein PHO08_18935 [Methylococcales bacterium]|nr:hypothetical protein [Methylococcales bacterium]
MKTPLIALLITLPLTASADYYQDYANYQRQMLIQEQQLLKIQQQNQAQVQMYRQQEQWNRQYQNQYQNPYRDGNEHHHHNNNGRGYNNWDRD